MGKIADAIQEIEDELDEVKTQLTIEEDKNEDLLKANISLQRQLQEYQEFVDYVEENHPDIYTAYRVVNRMEA